MWKLFSQIDKRLASSFTLVLLVAVGGFIAGQLYDKEPHLRYEILSQAPVYDLREDVTTLDILFEGKSIRQQHQMLSLITVRIENSGNATITKQSSYDPQFLPGFRVSNSRIVKADLLGASTDYLTNAIHLNRISENEFSFEPVIINKGENFTLKFLILHAENARPQLDSLGVIAGGQKITVGPIPNATDQKSFIAKVFSGSLVVQATRIIAYMFGGAVCLAVLVVGFTKLIETFTDKRRKRHVQNYENTLLTKPTKVQRFLLDFYVKNGESFVLRLNQLLNDPDQLREVKPLSDAFKRRTHTPEQLHVMALVWPPAIDDLIENEIVARKGESISANPRAVEEVRNFEIFLSGVIPKKVLRARGEIKSEPYGTESNPVADSESLKATATAKPNE